MGCQGSAPADDEPVEEETNVPAVFVEAESVSSSLHRKAVVRLHKLKELDAATKVPFILIEITGEANGEGEIEVCGKDEYGVYEALDGFFLGSWNCTKLDQGDLSEESKIPFCSAQYRWPGFITSGEEGLNNMGWATMRVIDFVCSQLSWTLAVVNGGNVGKMGEVRETQVIFKAPHPMNLVAPHMMIELRSAGFIEVCADLEEEHMEILASLDEYFADRFQAQLLDGHTDFCERYYKAGDDIFKGAAGSLDSNFGVLSIDICDKVVGYDGWSLVASNAGNYGETGEHCEQQLVFRRDYHPLGDAKYLQVIINEAGNIEINGQKQKEIHTKLGDFLMKNKKMRCSQAGEFWENSMMCRRYSWEVKKTPDILLAVSDVTTFFENEGWELQVASQQMVKEDGQSCRETQLLFRPGKTEVGTVEPHLFLELYAGEGKEELYADEEQTQVLANQCIRFRTIGPPRRCPVIAEAVKALESFIETYLEGEKKAADGTEYNCNVFLCRGRFENNLAQWTMRVCDYMVDRLGWNFVTTSLCNMGDQGQHRLQQLVFHWDGEKREIPVSLVNYSNTNAVEWEETELPAHWTFPEVLSRQQVQKVCSCGDVEKQALQLMLDMTFKRILTRDRRPDDEAPDGEEMPYRLEIVQVFRSEHACLHHRLTQKRVPFKRSDSFGLKTYESQTHLNEQLEGGEAYLFHGTNPSSAMNILRTGFVLDHAGSTTGMMYGHGIYAAECSSKADEYSRDDGGNTYPSLHAILVNRCFVGQPLVVHEAGAHTEAAKSLGYHCVCGDREGKVGTYRELIFFDEHQVYPEYAVIYKRVYDKEKVPEHMQLSTKGTTGRFWQMKVSSGWRNVPTEVNKMLIEASAKEEATVGVMLNGTQYTFDVQEKKATNQRTGTVVPLRAPMHTK